MKEAHSTVQVPVCAARSNRVGPRGAAFLATVVVLLGNFAVFPLWVGLWARWRQDPLMSIGALVPPVSLVLILRAWRSLSWELEGSWIGLWAVAMVVALVRLREIAVLELVLSPSISLFLPPPTLMAVCYAAGAVLLFGGVRLLRRAAFPVLLLALVVPVPGHFLLWVDLPLQHLSALTARGFAHLLGQHLSPDQLRLMFTPTFGMFIAPGCNGIRGSVTMGLIALVAGYVYQFRARVLAGFVASAVLLGYLLNLVRLCALVGYYAVALHVPWLQPRAEMGDYVIGGCLFFAATALLFIVIQNFGANGEVVPPGLSRTAAPHGDAVPFSFFPRLAALMLLLAVGSVTYGRTLVRGYTSPATRFEVDRLGPFPENVGGFHLERRWNDTTDLGVLVFYQGGYEDGDGNEVQVGVSPVLGAHDTLLCHTSRGEDWVWHGDLPLQSLTGPVDFTGSLYSDGPEQYVEATTLCTGSSCNAHSTDRTHVGLVWSMPPRGAFLNPDPGRPIPVMLRAVTHNPNLAPDAAQQELTEDLKLFMRQADLAQFTKPYRAGVVR